VFPLNSKTELPEVVQPVTSSCNKIQYSKDHCIWLSAIYNAYCRKQSS